MSQKFKNDGLGTRMKAYERAVGPVLMRRTPTIIRVDGKAFHTWTKKITKEIDPSLVDTPYSVKLHQVMVATAQALCTQIQNAEIAYTQSDEISIFLRDWDKYQTEQWFDAKVQKIVSVAGAMATGYFNYFVKLLLPPLDPKGIGQVPLFDARVFNLPLEEVANYFIWRQQDASRNSVQMLGRHYFSAKQMHGKNNSQVQDMLMELDTPVNWNEIPTWMKRGSCVIPNPNITVVDDNIPIFKEDRNYIEQHLLLNNKEELMATVEPITEVIMKGGPYDRIVEQNKKC